MTMPTVDTHDHHPLSATAGAAPAAPAPAPGPTSPSHHSTHSPSHPRSHSPSRSPVESRKRPFDDTQDADHTGPKGNGNGDGSSVALANGLLTDHGLNSGTGRSDGPGFTSHSAADQPHPTKKPRLEDLADAAMGVTVDALVAPPSPISFNPPPAASSSELAQQPSPSTLAAPAAVSPNALSLASSPSFSPAPVVSLPNPPTIPAATATRAPSPPPAAPLSSSSAGDIPQEKPTSTGPPAGVYSPFHPSTAAASALSSSLSGAPPAVAVPLAARAPSPTMPVSQQLLHQPATRHFPGSSTSSLSSRGSTPDSTATSATPASTTTTSAMGTPAPVKAEPPLSAAAAPAPASTSNTATRPAARPISQAQHKHLLSALRSVKRLKDAAPFTAPVDWKALNLPDYPLIIKRPMDLKTMESKLQAKEYPSVDALVSDFDTMVDNCVRYNGEKSIYSAMARKIRQSLDKHLERLPPPDPPVLAPPVGVSAIGGGPAPASVKREGPPASTTATAAAAAARRLSGMDFTVSAPAGSASQRKSSPGLAAFGSSVASSARSSTASLPTGPGAGSSSSLGLAGAASAAAAANAAARNQHEMDAALAVVRELFKRQYQEFAAPFLVPVDRRMYPQYYETIRQPMDFGTIRERLEAGGHYASAGQVEADCNLVFKNCFKFNPPGNPVRSMGMKLEALFKGMWSNRNAMIPPLPPPAPVAAAPAVALGSAASPGLSSSSGSGAPTKTTKKSRTAKSRDPTTTAGASHARVTATTADDEWNDLYDPADETSGEMFAIRSMEQSIAQMQTQLHALKERYLEGKRALRAAAAAAARPPAIASNASSSLGGAKKRTAGGGSKASRASAAATAAARNATAAAQARQHSSQPAPPHWGGSSGVAAAAPVAARHHHHHHHHQPAAHAFSGAPEHAASPAPTPAAVSLPAAAAPAPPTQQPEPPIPVTYDMKRLVSDRINNLTADLAEPVMLVLRETMALPDDQEEEVELDMNAMSDYTVYKLWELVRDDPPAEGAGEPVEAAAAPAPQQQQQQQPMVTSPPPPPPPQVPLPHGHHHHHHHRHGGQPPQRFMSLSAALGGGQSSDEDSDDGSSSGSDSD